MKTLEIFNSKSENKTDEYQALANSIYFDARETADFTANHMVEKIVEEMRIYNKKCQLADCEYTAYINCHAIELYYLRIQEQF